MSSNPVTCLLPRRSSLLACAVLLVCAAGCGDSAEANGSPTPGKSSAPGPKKDKDDRPTLVKVVSLAPEFVRDRLPATSHIEVLHQVEVLCQVRAQVKEVRVEQGQDVQEGDVLILMDDRDFALELENAKVGEAEAKNGKASADLEYEEAVSRLEQAERDLAKAERDFARDQRGVEQGVTSPEKLDTTTAARDRAKSELDLARVAKNKAKLGQNKAKTTWDSAKITRQLAERKLNDCTITAPITGVVARLDVRGGEWISPQGVLCQIVADRNLIVQLKRPQSELAILKTGLDVEVEVDAWPGEKFKAKIDLISPIVDPATGTFAVRARVDDPSHRLKPGMFCRAEVITRTSERALMIPKTAVLYDHDQPFAFVARDHKAKRIDIVAGIETKDQLEASNKNDTGGDKTFGFDDKLIVVDPTKLDDGQAVRFETEAKTKVETATRKTKPGSGGEPSSADAEHRGATDKGKTKSDAGQASSKQGNGDSR